MCFKNFLRLKGQSFRLQSGADWALKVNIYALNAPIPTKKCETRYLCSNHLSKNILKVISHWLKLNSPRSTQPNLYTLFWTSSILWLIYSLEQNSKQGQSAILKKSATMVSKQWVKNLLLLLFYQPLLTYWDWNLHLSGKWSKLVCIFSCCNLLCLMTLATSFCCQ